MSLLNKPLAQITAADIYDVCSDMLAESAQFEIKRSLSDEGSTDSPVFSERTRNKLAREIVSFANSYGGTLIIGIEESEDEPRRAQSKVPFANCDDVARRLRQAIHGIIDPPLPILEARGVVTEEDGHSGVVVVRLPKSRRAPHRLNANREVYIRREDEAVPIDMREIQELTIRSLSEARRIEDEIAKLKSDFQDRFLRWADTTAHSSIGVAFQLFGIPTAPLEIKVAGREDLRLPDFPTTVGGRTTAVWPFQSALRQWRPRLGALAAETDTDSTAFSSCFVTTQGTCELEYFRGPDEDRPVGLYAGWLVAALAQLLFWIQSVRNAASAPDLEYALACRISALGEQPRLSNYGARGFGRGYDEHIPTGEHDLPLLSVGARDEFEMLLVEFDELLWNLVGQHAPKEPGFFDLSAAPRERS